MSIFLFRMVKKVMGRGERPFCGILFYVRALLSILLGGVVMSRPVDSSFFTIVPERKIFIAEVSDLGPDFRTTQRAVDSRPWFDIFHEGLTLTMLFVSTDRHDGEVTGWRFGISGLSASCYPEFAGYSTLLIND
jgi:hypothetical protein